MHTFRRLGHTAALSLVAGVLAGCASSGAASVTVLGAVSAAVVVAPDGGVSTAYSGERLVAGAEVRTGADGGAVLLTAGRSTWLGPDAALLVRSGIAATLRSGAALVDARNGPRITVAVGDVSVSSGNHAVLRLERGYTVRVGVLAGSAAVTSIVGRRLDVPELYQVIATGDALPGTPSPLVLVDDAAEQALGLPVVTDDLALRSLARGIDAADPRRDVVSVVQVALQVLDPLSLPRDRSASEAVLPVAIARSTGGAPAFPQRYASAVALRDAGGSWGVVADLLGTTALRTGEALGSLEQTLPTLTALPIISGAVGGGGTLVPGGPGGGGPSASAVPTSTPTPSPTRSGSRSPAPSPSPSASGLLSQLVTTVQHLLPTPLPSTVGLRVGLP